MGRIFDIKNFSVNDGPGIRTTFFLKGCSLNCRWCHNPEGKDYRNDFVINQRLCLKNCNNCEKVCPIKANKGKILNNNMLNDCEDCRLCNLCSENCLSGSIKVYGKEISKYDILKIIDEQHELYNISKGGITFSGGDPFFQFEFLNYVCKSIKNKFDDIDIAVETSLNTDIGKIVELSNYVDLFIVDFKCLDQDLSNQYVGMNVTRFFNNFSKLIELNKKIWIRMVAIKDVTFCDKNIDIFRKYLCNIEKFNIEKIQFLEYHSMAFPKYDELKLKKYNFSRLNKSEIGKVIDEFSNVLGNNIMIEYLTI